MEMHPFSSILDFVRESNRIEGILREPTDAEVSATMDFLARRAPEVLDVENLVGIYQPDAVLRLRPGLNVRVGSHVAPPGGPEIGARLAELLDEVDGGDPWATHIAYETLHPFTDGNGRSGRAIWAWQMVRRREGLGLGFLHRFYYQTLAAIGR
jgi:hypothetical protein